MSKRHAWIWPDSDGHASELYVANFLVCEVEENSNQARQIGLNHLQSNTQTFKRIRGSNFERERLVGIRPMPAAFSTRQSISATKKSPIDTDLTAFFVQNRTETLYSMNSQSRSMSFDELRATTLLLLSASNDSLSTIHCDSQFVMEKSKRREIQVWISLSTRTIFGLLDENDLFS